MIAFLFGFLVSRCRVFVGALGVVSVVVTFLVVDSGSARAEEERRAPVVGSFAVGGSVTAGIDERSGVFATQVPLVGLPGVGGSGGVGLAASYSQNAAAAGDDTYGLGAGWMWGFPRVQVDGGVRVVTPSGDVYSASETPDETGRPKGVGAVSSGLEGYVLGDLVFSQTENTFLESRDNVGGRVPYAYSLENMEGVTDYFGPDGHLLARVDAYGHRVDWHWNGNELARVTDDVGSVITLNWGDGGVEIVSPPRSDGIVASTVLEIIGNRLVSITNPTDERDRFTYNTSGLLERVNADSGAETTITYQPLPNDHLPHLNRVTVNTVRVTDSSTGELLSERSWAVKGLHNSQGSPKYSGAGHMWASGDGSYQYQTVLTDGETRIESVYNSMGLMLSRDLIVSTVDGEYTAQQQAFTYAGTEHGGVPEKSHVPEQYAKPTNTTVTYRDNKGGTRQVTETTVFDTTGRVIEHTAADGSVTTTEYDAQTPTTDNIATGTSNEVEGASTSRTLPYGLVTNQTTTGADGTVSVTTNTLTDDHKAIRATDISVGVPDGALERTSRTEYTVKPDGFISEQKIIATGPVSEGPKTVTTRFDRVVDTDTKTVTASRTDAAGTEAESTTSSVTDLVTGLQLSATDPTGRVAASTYDRAGRVTTQTAPGGLRTVTEHERNTTRVIQPTGVITSERVDALGRTIEISDNIATIDGVHGPRPETKRIIETREYENNGSTVIAKDARGLETVTASDVFGRSVSVKSPSHVVQLNVYDDVANTVTTGLVPPSGTGLKDALLVTTRHLDDSNRDTTTTKTRKDAVRVPEQATKYDGLGRVTTHTSGDISTSLILNPDGTPKTTTLTPTETASFPGETITAEREHDLMGVPTKKTLARGDGQTREGTSRVLDAAGRTITETNQAGHATEYDYTIDGLTTTVNNTATGVTTTNTYDKTTRALIHTETVNPTAGTSRTRFEYHPITGDIVNICDPDNCEVTRISYTYDIFGNTTLTTYPDGKTIRHTFDQFGRQTTSTDITGNTTEYVYDHIGRLQTATQTNPQGNIVGSVTYTYDEYGRTTQLSRNNGVITHYTFTSANEILTETTTNHHGATILDARYEYDPHGNLTTRLDIQPDGTDTTKHITETTTHAYNAHNQLIESRIYPGDTTKPQENGKSNNRTLSETPNPSQEPDPSRVTEYEIGVSGEVTKETITENGATTTREFEYNPLGQTTAITTKHNTDTIGHRVTQTYDTAGNLTQAVDGTTYTYNAHNQPVTETHPSNSTTQHTYWANGQRQTLTTTDHQQISGTQTTSVGLYWDGTTLINDTHTTTDTAPSTTASYLIGTSRHTRTLNTDVSNTAYTNAQANAGQTNYYVTDRHGNTTAMAGPAGDITTTYRYTDYGTTTERRAPEQGAVTQAERNPFQYASEYTTNTGKQFLNTRTYDPGVFGFTTHDTADQFNLYAYANSNPITMVDPTGQTAEFDWQSITSGLWTGLGLVLAAIGLAFAAVPVGASWALAHIGIRIGVVASVADLAFTSVQVADEYAANGKGFMTDTQSEILTWTSLALGALSFIAGMAVAGNSAARFGRIQDLEKNGENARATATKLMHDYNETPVDYHYLTNHTKSNSIVNEGFNSGNTRLTNSSVYLSSDFPTARRLSHLSSDLKPAGEPGDGSFYKILTVHPQLLKAAEYQYDNGFFKLRNPFWTGDDPDAFKFVPGAKRFRHSAHAIDHSISKGYDATGFVYVRDINANNLLVVHKVRRNEGVLQESAIRARAKPTASASSSYSDSY